MAPRARGRRAAWLSLGAMMPPAMMPPAMMLVVMMLAALMLAGCAAPPSATSGGACRAGQGSRMAAYELFLGRSMPGHRDVSEADWTDFLDQVVTPNLPDGYTVFDGAGYWRNPATGRNARERSKVLLAVVPDTPARAAAVARVRAAYAARFHQSVVGLAVMPVCGDF